MQMNPTPLDIPQVYFRHRRMPYLLYFLGGGFRHFRMAHMTPTPSLLAVLFKPQHGLSGVFSVVYF